MDIENAEIAESKVDTVYHENIPAKDALAQYSDAERRRAFRKLDWTLIPLYDYPSSFKKHGYSVADTDRLGVLYMLSYIDRGNVGNAYTAGMGKEWGITSNQYSWIITAYYLAYIAFHWLILAWKLVSLPVCIPSLEKIFM